MLRSEVRSLVMEVLARMLADAGEQVRDFIRAWLEPCTRLVLAHLRLDAARDDKARVRVAWWEWRTRVLGARCAAQREANGCTALDVAQRSLEVARNPPRHTSVQWGAFDGRQTVRVEVKNETGKDATARAVVTRNLRRS